MDRQRIYDAMLIKAFRSDITIGYLYYWLKPYNIAPPDKDLLRQPPMANKMSVRVFVGTFLKPLADRLWDTDPSQDVKTLDWMKGLECQQNRAIDYERRKLRRDTMIDYTRTILLGRNLDRKNPSNQWHVTKPKSNIRRVK
jgi:hypothetical protein